MTSRSMGHALCVIPHVIFHPRPSPILKTLTITCNGEGLGMEATEVANVEGFYTGVKLNWDQGYWPLYSRWLLLRGGR